MFRNSKNKIKKMTFNQNDVPSTNTIGASWWNPSKKEFKVFNGSSWIPESPPSGPGSDYSYQCGGQLISDFSTIASTIERASFPFDGGNSQVGSFTSAAKELSGCNSTTFGYFGYSYMPDESDASCTQRIEFPFDSGTSSIYGHISNQVQTYQSFNSSAHGYFAGGKAWYNSSDPILSIISRITFPFDNGSNIGTCGYLRIENYTQPESCNSSTNGYCLILYSSSSSGLSMIDRLSFPFDSGSTTNVGISSVLYQRGMANSSKYGYLFGGGLNGSSSAIDRIEFPFDSGTSMTVGGLSTGQAWCTSSNSSTKAFITGGLHTSTSTGTTFYSTISQVEFPFDSGVAVATGATTTLTYRATIDGTDFASMFV